MSITPMDSEGSGAMGVLPQAASAGGASYVVITPVRNEAQHIENTIHSVLRQTARPLKWVIVDDGSSDATAAIVERHARDHEFIELVRRPDRGFRKAGGGVVDAFYAGYERLDVGGWEFLVKLDGDLSFEPDYFECCLREFAHDDSLGIGGGGIWHREGGRLVLEENPRFHVRGATKIYRRACWEAIGGLARSTGWDTLDELAASHHGWKTRAFLELKIEHHRRTGQAEGTWKNAVKNGRGAYAVGYHPVFFLAKSLRRLPRRPFAVEGLGLLYGFCSSYWKRMPRIADPSLIQYVRRQQLRRLFLRESIWK